MALLQEKVESSLDAQERLIRRAWADEEFAELLKTNPRVAIAEETGVEIPGDLQIVVHQETETEMHLVIPRRPVQDTRLEERLRKAGQARCTYSNDWTRYDILGCANQGCSDATPDLDR